VHTAAAAAAGSPQLAPPGAMVVFNGPSSAGKTALVKSLQQRLAARSGGVPILARNVYLKVAYDDLDVLLPENALPDLMVWQDGTPRLRQPDETAASGGDGGRQPGQLGFNGPGTSVYYFEDRRATLQSAQPAQAILNSPSADTCLRGQHRAWVAMCGAGNNLLVDHWLQEPWWRDDLKAAIAEGQRRRQGQRGPSSVHFVHVSAAVAELERREKDRGDRVLGTSRWSSQHGEGLKHGDSYALYLDSGRASTDEMAATVIPPFPSFVWALLTEIHRCHACSCQEILRLVTARQVELAMHRWGLLE
jgi:chloramphenicol 3-O-phosphotransferase